VGLVWQINLQQRQPHHQQRLQQALGVLVVEVPPQGPVGEDSLLVAAVVKQQVGVLLSPQLMTQQKEHSALVPHQHPLHSL
jgi:hypothetical protein